jgi:hypothetical protein
MATQFRFERDANTQAAIWIKQTAPDVAGLLRLKASAPIKPRKPQIPCDVGLFSDEADQLDLIEMFQDAIDDGD